MNQRFPILLLAICIALLGGCIYWLLRDRFVKGDVYPPYSSLRSDPLGTMIFYESLEALPGIEVERDHSIFNRLPDGRGTAYLHLAASTGSWSSTTAELHRTLDAFLLQGGRLVITLAPQYGIRRDPDKESEGKSDNKNDKPAEKDARKDENEEKASDDDSVSLEEKWGLKFTHGERGKGGEEAERIANFALPDKLHWNGDVYLENPDESWTVVYRNALGPVLAERKRGAGSIVVATDSYFLSNEALVQERQPGLLAWLVDPARRIVFDEAHLGITDTPGIAALARKYHLEGGIAALIVLAALFIWKSAAPFGRSTATGNRPPPELAGRSAGAGFVSLLRRNISRGRIFEVCVQEWSNAFRHRASSREIELVETVAREEAARPPRQRDSVAASRTITDALRRRPFKRPV